MNYRVQVIPLSLARVSGKFSPTDPQDFRIMPEMEFFRSWIDYDFESEFAGRRRLNWNALLGIFFAFGMSAGFWAAAGFLAAHLLK